MRFPNRAIQNEQSGDKKNCPNLGQFQLYGIDDLSNRNSV